MKLAQIVYPLTKPLVELAISIYHRKVYYSNAERIPKNQPVLFVSNHPTAFLEPVIYAGLLDKPIHSLVRGDFFQSKVARIGLESLYMVAIYRMRDGGVEGLRKNAETFGYCYDLLANHKQVLIMAEGFTKQQKRLAPLQKGAARMALGAAQGRKLNDLVVIPLGANFTEANTFRGDVMIEVGEPLSIAQYLEQYRSSKKEAIDTLTKDMSSAMRKTIIHIADEADDALFEKVVTIARRQVRSSLWPSWVRIPDRFQVEKKSANYINNAIDKETLSQLVDAYPKGIHLRSQRSLLNMLVLLVAFPIWIVGRLYRFIPFSIARNIVKNKVQEREFESPIRFGMGALFYISLSLVFLLLIVIVLGWKWIWLPFVLTLAVWVSIIYDDLIVVMRHIRNWRSLAPEEQQKAIRIESQIAQYLNLL